MVEKTQNRKEKYSKNVIRKGLIVAGLCVVGCNVPILLAFIGIGSLGAVVSVFGHPLMAATVGLLGVTSLFGYFLFNKNRRARP